MPYLVQLCGAGLCVHGVFKTCVNVCHLIARSTPSIFFFVLFCFFFPLSSETGLRRRRRHASSLLRHWAVNVKHEEKEKQAK